MASESYDISRLEAIHKKHAAKILDLSRELEHVKHENEALRDLVHGKRGPDFCDASWTGDKYKKAEEGSIHDDDFGLGPDGKPKRYWGFNKFYTPEMATSKRWEDLQNVYSKVSGTIKNIAQKESCCEIIVTCEDRRLKPCCATLSLLCNVVTGRESMNAMLI